MVDLALIHVHCMYMYIVFFLIYNLHGKSRNQTWDLRGERQVPYHYSTLNAYATVQDRTRHHTTSNRTGDKMLQRAAKAYIIIIKAHYATPHVHHTTSYWRQTTPHSYSTAHHNTRHHTTQHPTTLKMHSIPHYLISLFHIIY